MLKETGLFAKNGLGIYDISYAISFYPNESLLRLAYDTALHLIVLCFNKGGFLGEALHQRILQALPVIQVPDGIDYVDSPITEVLPTDPDFHASASDLRHVINVTLQPGIDC